MLAPLHLLFIEADPDRINLVVQELRRAAYEPAWQAVAAEPDYIAALAEPTDIIIASINMTTHPDCARALALLEERRLHIPLIVLADTHTETEAIRCVLNDGAADYVRADALARLGPTVTRILREREQRATAQQQAEARFRQRMAHTEMLASISRLLVRGGLNYHTLLDTVVQQIAETMGDACTIRMLSDDQQVFSLVASYHPDPEIVRDLRSLAAAERHIAIPGTHKDVLETGQSRLIPRLDPDHLEGLMPPESQRFVQRHRVHSLLVVPLRVQGQTIGMISIARQEHHAPYTSEDQIALQDVADQLARSITNARLHEAVQQAHSELEQRVDERTRELSVSNERLRQEISQRSRIEHALRESEARYRLLADHATDLVFRSTLEGVILYASPACRTMLGYEPHEMVGQSAYVFTHPDDYEHIGARISEMVQNRSVQVTSCRMLHKQGHVVWVEIAAQCTYDAQTGEPQEIIGIDRDITERKQAEEEIQRLHHTVQQRAQELEAANRELEAFSYSVSHDLQTPLRVVDGFCEILTELAPPTLPAAMLHYIERIRHNVQRMQQLIDGLLTLSQLSRQQLSYQRVEVAVLAQQVYNEIRQSYPAQQSELVLGNVPACQADPLLLRQVLANFMSNAFKFTRTRTISYIEVGAQQDEDSDDTIYYVRDNGIGFDSRHATRIFGLFQRLHRPEEFAGTGAGLAIAQRIIHRHGGRIWAEAEVNQGATFYFTLPRDG